MESSNEEIKQLEDFLKRSGFSTQSSDGDASDVDSEFRLRSCVKRFLDLKINQDMSKVMDMADSQKKTVSFAVNNRQKLIEDQTNLLVGNGELNASQPLDPNETRPLDLEEKKSKHF